MKKIIFHIFLFAVMIPVIGGIARAQDDAPKPEILPEISDSIVDYERSGWHPRLKFNGNFSLGQSKNVPGNTDGVSLQVGTLLHATLDYLSNSKSHEWTNSLRMELGHSKTPVVDAWIKSMDSLDFETAYLYHFPRALWMGPVYRLKMTTSMLPGYEVRSAPATVVKLDSDDVPYGMRTYSEGKRIKLTDAFGPLTLRQLLGLFFRPVSRPAFRLDSNLGLGMWKTWTRGGYIIDDDDGTDELELRQIDNPFQLGAEFEAVVGGELKDNLVAYSLGAMLMYPFYSDRNDATELSGLEKLNREVYATLCVNVTKYLSINYSFKAMRYPLIIDKIQFQNSLLISVGFDLIGNPPPAPAKKTCDCADAVAAAKADWEADQTKSAGRPDETAADTEAKLPEKEKPPAPEDASEADDAPAADEEGGDEAEQPASSFDVETP